MIIAKARRDSCGTDNIKFSVIFPIQIITPILSKAYGQTSINTFYLLYKTTNLHGYEQSCEK